MKIAELAVWRRCDDLLVVAVGMDKQQPAGECKFSRGTVGAEKTDCPVDPLADVIGFEFGKVLERCADEGLDMPALQGGLGLDHDDGVLTEATPKTKS